MEEPHVHCMSCVSRRCMMRPEPGVSCDLITCPLVCGAVFHICKMQEHRFLCPLERVPCLNCSFGCPFVLARCKMAEHLEVCPAGVVCCTMEWNRWPVNDEDYRSYERLSRDAEEVEQLDMALALQDQRTMLASLKLVSMAPTSGTEKKTTSEKLETNLDLQSSAAPVTDGAQELSSACSSKDRIANGVSGQKEERYCELYQNTVETTKSLAAALSVLINRNASTETDCTNRGESAIHPEQNGECGNTIGMREDVGSSCDRIANGVSGLNEELQPQQHQTLMELGRSLASALGALGEAVTGIEPINGAVIETSSQRNGELHQTDTLDSASASVKDSTSGFEEELGAFGGADNGDTSSVIFDKNGCMEFSSEAPDEAPDEADSASLGATGEQGLISRVQLSSDRPRDESETQPVKLNSTDHQSLEPSDSWEFIGPLIPHRPEVRHDLVPILSLEPSGSQPPPLQQPPCAPAFAVPRDGSLPSMVLDFEDRAFEKKLQNLQLLRSFMPLALNGRKGPFPETLHHHRPRCKMEDKAVDTSDLEQEPPNDPMGLGEIDFTAAALLFCLEESPRARRISDTVYSFGGSRVDFGTQTFTFPAAILATSTMVGEVASASACDRAAPRLSQPSPFCTLRLDLTLEQLVPRTRWAPREGSMFTFECGQLFRREEFLSHFRNVHGDIHAGLNGWMEHRCPLAYYGCTYSQRRFCPSSQGARVIHDRHLRSFGVQPRPSEPVTTHNIDHISGLPFEVLQHVARFLDGFSLCQLSMVSRTMRDVCASLLQTRGMVVVVWEKRQCPDGTQTWQIKDKVWRFSTAFSPVNSWKFADIASMADHLKRCPYNEVHRQVEAVPLPCMCTTRELTRDGRSLRSVLKPVL
ncbi:F-box only protein 30b [Chanos chanos]|uniref:F-box only protein 30b n=1 Tax=Chanos chanos TaxID=29144 RepID=A0A6J2WCY2_CHACN|nr:F-box only protein 30-like [Chanos chanos]